MTGLRAAPRRLHRLFVAGVCLVALALSAVRCTAAAADAQLPELTQPVNDFAHVIDADSERAIDDLSRRLQAATGDVIVVATSPNIEPYGDIREYAVALFANGGRGIGEKGKDNGVLVLLTVKERRVWIEVGYGLEEWITDGYAGETSREYMIPEFRNGRYGAGLLAGVSRIVGRIADARNVSITGLQVPRERAPEVGFGLPIWAVALFFIVVILLSRYGGGPGRGPRFWGGGPWSGWSSGVGPFGGGWTGGGFGGGGFGGGFGGFGGGRSGGGGGGGGW